MDWVNLSDELKFGDGEEFLTDFWEELDKVWVEGNFNHWFTSQMLRSARAWPGWSQETGAPVCFPSEWQELKYAESSSATCPDP